MCAEDVVITPLHRHYSRDHLRRVMGEMQRLGRPRLRGYFDAASGAWLLCEGTHRVRAAHMLGMTPEIVAVPWWRSSRALERARFASAEYGLRFEVMR